MTSTIFQTLLALDVGKFVEKKGKFSYLSWSYAVAELRKHAPDATWAVLKFPLPEHAHVLAPYCITPAGCFVEVAVTVAGITLAQTHPIIDERNTTIKAPNAGDVNKSIMRCLVKAIALHGLGLNVYAGEDLPLGDDDDKPTKKAAASGPTEADRVKGAKIAIAEQCRRLGVGPLHIASRLCSLNRGVQPTTAAEYEHALAALKEASAEDMGPQ
jgi:hypothetical protein